MKSVFIFALVMLLGFSMHALNELQHSNVEVVTKTEETQQLQLYSLKGKIVPDRNPDRESM